ncbi:MAG: carboxylating nicotinate-nucleotide diphosphorylase, partial [Oscillospiraceae bacterium]|nr:carboxylating nicotinate-nucleotide diphosphorylase [Oscillospiraceae bacterium]
MPAIQPVYTEFFGLGELIASALREDIGAGDITTLSCVPEDAFSRGLFRMKEDGVVCGLFILPRVFEALSPSVVVTPLVREGAEVKNGEIIAEIEGPSRAVLTGERVALNLLQHLSGVATRTAAAVRAVSGLGAQIVDTRKTTPGLRALEKYAVRMGGGRNHRFGLGDGVLIKDNHIAAAGGIARAVAAARSASPHTLKIEVETETSAQVVEALSAGADIIMLDNMTTEAMAE